MADPSVIVGFVQQVEPPGVHPEGTGFEPMASRRAVHFASRTVYLDSQTPECAVEMTTAPFLKHRPLYVRVRRRADYEAITTALLPVVTRVVRITPLPGGAVQVDLECSSAPHVLRPSAGEFLALQDFLYWGCETDTIVVVTGDPESHDILDVRLVASLQFKTSVSESQPSREEIRLRYQQDRTVQSLATSYGTTPKVLYRRLERVRRTLRRSVD